MLLAWLLMTVSLPAMSVDATAGTAKDGHALVMDHVTHGHAAAISSHHSDRCCGSTTHLACHCEAMCGSLLLPSVSSLYGLTLLATARVPTRHLDAPAPDLIPPLRPPAA